MSRISHDYLKKIFESEADSVTYRGMNRFMIYEMDCTSLMLECSMNSDSRLSCMIEHLSDLLKKVKL